MKRTTKGFFFALTTMAVLLSCKKDMSENISLVADEIHVQKLKTWYESVALDTKSRKIKVDGVLTKVEESPAWDETRYYPENDMTISPIKIGALKPNAPAIKYLVAKGNAKGQLGDINYYKLFEGKDKPTNKSLTINNVSFISKIIAGKNIPTDFTGVLLKYSGDNNLLSTTKYKNGLLVSPKSEDNQVGEGEENIAPVDCTETTIDSWWVVYINGSISSIDYMYSTTYTICPTGGNGGNTTTCSALLSNMYSGTTISDESKSYTIIEENATTRTALYEWFCLKNPGGWKVYSIEKAVHVKTNNPNPDLQWQFQSASHEGIGLVGIVLGGSIEPTCIASNFTIGLYNMHVALNLDVKYSLACSISPIATTLSYSPHRGFNIYQGEL